MKKKNVLVSICCLTYNQEKYIKETIDSFLRQKTNFDYEIVIHDDASTDKTTSIIKDYQKKYSNIELILPTENRDSKGEKIYPHLFHKASGKYIAMCDGDNYWIDPLKLQKQVNFMESHPKCSLITTKASLLDDITKKMHAQKIPYHKSKYISTKDTIIYEGNLFPTSSMFFKKKDVIKLPKFYYIAPVGDYPLTMYLSLKGKIYYMHENSCIYRTNVKGSWTTSQKEGDIIKKRRILFNGYQKMMKEFNIYTQNKYQKQTEYVLLKKEFEATTNKKEINTHKQEKYKKLYKKGPLTERLKYYLKIKMNWFYTQYKKMQKDYY